VSEKEKYKEELIKLRKDFDEIDDKILELLNKRGNYAITIGNIKKNLNLEIYQPKREEELIERIKNKKTIAAIWKEIISASKAVQGTISKVGYLGPIGTFTHQASLEYFAKAGTEFIPNSSTSDIFDSIEKGELDFGVVPFENSLQGTVRETLDLLIERELFI
jgi:chorismate mutase/prephenate dehydratase